MQKAVFCTARRLFAFNFVDFSSLVVPAVRANLVGLAHVTAVGALHQAGVAKRMMRSAAIAAAFGNFTLW